MTEAVAVVQQFLDAFNARDLDAFVACLAEDAQQEYAGQSTLIGKEAIRTYYQPLFARDLHQHSLLLDRTFLGPHVIDKEYVTGRTPEPFIVLACYYVVEGKIHSLRLLRDA